MMMILYILLAAAAILSVWASFRVRSVFDKWSEVRVASGMTGFEAARRMLNQNGLHSVCIEMSQGELSDHYDPTSRTVRLSPSVYGKNTVSAVSVACHEVGHAIQHSVNYPMLAARHSLFPVTSFASGVAPFLLLAGMIFVKFKFLLLLGIIFFSASVIFQLVTLPVEFDASRRARKLMLEYGFVGREEEQGAGKVLNAAALTYVAAAAVSVLELLRYVLMFANRRD